MTANSQK